MVILNKKLYIYIYVSYSERSKVELFHCTSVILLIKRYYVLFLTVVFFVGICCSSDKVGTVYLMQYIFENSTFNINARCTSCENMTCCSAVCVLTFLHVGDNTQYVNEQFVSCIHFCSVHFTLHPTTYKGSNGAQYGGSAGQYWAPNSNSCTMK